MTKQCVCIYWCQNKTVGVCKGAESLKTTNSCYSIILHSLLVKVALAAAGQKIVLFSHQHFEVRYAAPVFFFNFLKIFIFFIINIT